MAVVARIGQLRLQDNVNGTTHVLQWSATAVNLETPAGGSVDITIERTTAGVPPGDPNTLLLNMYNDSRVVIRSFTLDPTAATQTVTFYFNDNGTFGGNPRVGTVEIAIRATRTDPVAYDVETDGSPNTVPAGFVSVLDRGWIQGTTTLIEAISNVALGGAKNQPAQYDESLFVRTTSGAASYTARSLTVASTVGGLSGSTNSTTAAQRDVTFPNVVDDRFPAGVTSVGVAVTVPNSTLTGFPDWTYTTTTDDTINVDPRLTASHHFQTDDNTFALSKNDTSKSMLSTQTGFLATRLVTSRTLSGVNGLTVLQTLTPQSPGTAVSSSTTTATRDGQTGWTGFLDWVSSKPGGTWNKSLAITAPTDIDGAGYVLNGTDSGYTMLAPDPRISIRGYIEPTTGTRHHLTAGVPAVVTAVVEDITTGVRIASSRVTEVAFALVNFNVSTTRLEYLDSTLTWNVWDEAEAEHFFSMTPAVGDARLYVRFFTATETLSWDKDIRVVLRCKVDGTPYGGFSVREETANLNRHDTADTQADRFDPVAFALNNVVSFK